MGVHIIAKGLRQSEVEVLAERSYERDTVTVSFKKDGCVRITTVFDTEEFRTLLNGLGF